MARKGMTDAEVEAEIAALRNDDAVKLARIVERQKYARRQALYRLRYLKKQGEELHKLGLTIDSFEDDGEF